VLLPAAKVNSNQVEPNSVPTQQQILSLQLENYLLVSDEKFVSCQYLVNKKPAEAGFIIQF
jgi:hypothetical protein